MPVITRVDRGNAIERLKEAGELLYDKWENGEGCHEISGDEMGAFLGKAFQLSEAEEGAILALIKGIPTPSPMQIVTQRAENAERRSDELRQKYDLHVMVTPERYAELELAERRAERLKGHAEALLEQLRTMRIHFVSTLESARERNREWRGM